MTTFRNALYNLTNEVCIQLQGSFKDDSIKILRAIYKLLESDESEALKCPDLHIDIIRSECTMFQACNLSSLVAYLSYLYPMLNDMSPYIKFVTIQPDLGNNPKDDVQKCVVVWRFEENGEE